MFRIGDEVKVKVTHVDVDERMIDFQIVGMPLPKNDKSQRPARGKTIQAKTRGKSLDKSKDDNSKGNKKKRKQRKGKNARKKDKQGKTNHKPFYKDKSVKKKSRRKKK